MIFLFGLVVVLGCLLVLSIFDNIENEDKKDAEKRRINRLQNDVKEDLEEITEYADRFGDDFSKSLISFADKMENLTKDDIKRDLKPYDIYNTQRLHNQFSGLGTMLGRIVINKNLEPRFMVSPPSTIPSRADIQLEAALTIEEVKELANKCLRIKMDADIEKFRKDKVNKAINNK
jgi:hypothetical protein